MKVNKSARHNGSIPKSIKYIIGVDEVGRGPLAGPVAVGAFLAPTGSNLKIFKGARDSKKMNLQSREKCFKQIKAELDNGQFKYVVSFASPQRIDKQGLTKCIRSAINSSLRRLDANPTKCLVLLDGGLAASPEFIYQKTIIRGDDREKIISLASIVAKVTRDRRMIRLAKKHPKFNFEKHKGYGTSEHLRLIKKFGPSPIHRLSFMGNLLK